MSNQNQSAPSPASSSSSTPSTSNNNQGTTMKRSELAKAAQAKQAEIIAKDAALELKEQQEKAVKTHIMQAESLLPKGIHAYAQAFGINLPNSNPTHLDLIKEKATKWAKAMVPMGLEMDAEARKEVKNRQTSLINWVMANNFLPTEYPENICFEVPGDFIEKNAAVIEGLVRNGVKVHTFVTDAVPTQTYSTDSMIVDDIKFVRRGVSAELFTDETGRVYRSQAWNSKACDSYPVWNINTLAQDLFVFDAAKYSSLTSFQLASLLGIIHGEAVKVDGTKVESAYGDWEVNLARKERRVTIGSKSRTMMNQILVNGTPMDTKYALFVLVNNIISKAQGAKKFVAALNNLFQRDINGYGTSDFLDPSKVISDGIFMEMEITEALDFPYVELVNGGRLKAATIELFATKKAPFMVDKYALEFVGGATAANAAGVGRCVLEVTREANHPHVKFMELVKATADDKIENTVQLVEGFTKSPTKVIGIIDFVISMHDASKAAKFFNRVTQARKHSKAELFDESERMVSGFGVWVEELGEVVHQSGAKLLTGFSNSRILTFGSGPAALNPHTFIKYGVKKSFRGTFNRLSLRKKQRVALGENAKQMEFITNEISLAMEQELAQGKVYYPGDTILKWNGEKLIVNRNLNQPVIIESFSPVEPIKSKGVTGKYEADCVDFTCSVRLVVKDQALKFRNDGVKLTSYIYDLSWFVDCMGAQTANVVWDLLLNVESVKGNLAKLGAFVNSNGGGVYYPNTGWVKMNDGREMFLGQEFDENGCPLEFNNDYTRWVKANTSTKWVQFDISRKYWEDVKAADKEIHWVYLGEEVTEAIDAVVVQETTNCVTIREKVEVLFADYFYEVEVSTPRENTGKTGFTPEQLAVLSVVSPDLAKTLHEESREYRSVVRGLSEMANGKGHKNAAHISLTSTTGREALFDALVGGLVEGFNLDKLANDLGKDSVDDLTYEEILGIIEDVSDSSVMSIFKSAFPHGVVFESQLSEGGKVKLALDFNVLRGMTTFLGDSASGIAKDVVGFLRYIAMPDDSGVDSVLRSWTSKLHTGLRGWIETAYSSQGILKRLVRSAKCAGTSKVRTMGHPLTQPDEDGIPKVLLHPQDDLLKVLAKDINTGKTAECYTNPDTGKFDPSFLDGEFIGIGRQPMPMLVGCKIVVSEYGYIGHAVCDPRTWSAGNEGE